MSEITLGRSVRKRGVTLIEAVLFISIALGLIVGGLVFFQQANLAQRSNDAVRTVSSLASEARALYRTQQSFEDLEARVLIGAGAVPQSIVNGNQFRNEWGGDAAIFGTNAAGAVGADDFFTVVYIDIPAEACTRLATLNNGSGPVGSDIVAVLVDEDATRAAISTTGTAGSDTLTLNGLADASGTDDNVTPAEAATACGTADADVAWVFSR